MHRPTFLSWPAGRLARAAPVAAGLALAAAIVPAGMASAADPLPPNCIQQSAQTVKCTFGFTGGSQSWTAPAGVSQATVLLNGAQGAFGGAPGGLGAIVTATIPVIPGDTYQLQVGGQGLGPAGGFGGGGSGVAAGPAVSGGGGGGTAFALGFTVLVEAGGGGGAGGFGLVFPGGPQGPPGGPGGPSAGPGIAGVSAPGFPGTAGGGGGAGSTGGAGGTPGTGPAGSGTPGAPGRIGQGGFGGGPSQAGGAGGGGGGGFLGGGGGGGGGTSLNPFPPTPGAGGGGGGGGGGSDFVTPQATSPSVADGVFAGNGEAIITYTQPLTTTTTTLGSSANPSVIGQQVTYTATVSPAPDGGAVAFTDGGMLITGCETVAVSSTGTATCQVTYNSAGTHSIIAAYSGDTAFGASSGSLTQTVNANTVAVANPGNQTGTVGTAVSLQMNATDSQAGQTFTWSASGLPAGLSINSGSGLISGTPTTAGASSVTVTATDTTGASGSASFTWTINSQPPPACPPGTKANFRWHYTANGNAGGWSGTATQACPGTFSMGPQAMDGNLQVAPFTILQAGYDFTLPGNKNTLTMTVSAAQVTFAVSCVSGATPSQPTLTVALSDQTYAITNDQWIPSGDQSSPLVYQGAVKVPDLCGGGKISLAKGGTFTATLG